MKTFWKYIKNLFKWFFFLLVFLFLVTVFFVIINPEFGGNPTGEDVEQFKKTGHYEDGRFKKLPINIDGLFF